MNSDLISIIMPSYNTADYISESIKSVQAQTYDNWELLIVDDCSTDNTDEIVEAFLSDHRIHYLKNEKNSGAAVSRNKALRNAKGQWIAFLDSDDLWTKDKLERQIEFMKNNHIYFSYTKYKEINEDSTLNGVCLTGPRKITRRGMYHYCWPGCLTVMYNAERVGLVQIADIKKNNDYAMWLQVCEKENCYLLDDFLAFYRKRSGSISNHSYWKLIKWHYNLFHVALNKNTFCSAIYTAINLFFGVIKKIKYKKIM